MDKLIRRKVFISMLFIGLTMMGLFSYSYLPMELYPNAEYPSLHVSISSKTNLDPKYIENQAVIPVEGVISGMEGVEEINTRIGTQNANITVSFSQKTNIKYAYLKLEEKLKAVTKNLPEEFTVHISKAGAGMAKDQFMTLQILSDEDIDYVRNITDADIVPILESTDGIASVNVIGGRQKSIEILLDKEKCKALNITASQISSLISDNMAEKTFAGPVYEDSKRYFVNITAEYLSTDDLADIVVAEGPVLLKDIADINFGIKKEESYSRVNGKEVITCIVAQSPLANIIDLSERVREEIAQLNTELEAKGVSILIDNDMAETMNKNIDIIIHLAVTGAILAIFILYLFLRNFKIVTFIAFAIPISVFSAFYFFYFFGISINTLTLTGIALAVGMLLDNSVVVMENIFRLRALGIPREEAAIQGTKEVSKAVTAATLTTITVFLPFLFSDDYLLKLIGEHVGISIITTLLLSLVVALLLIPMAVNQFMKKQGERVNFSTVSIHSRPVQIYMALLKICLRKPSTVIFSALLLLVITLSLSLTLSLNTLKEIEADTFNLYLTFPNGNTLSQTDETIRLYEDRLQEIPEIEQYNSQVFSTDARMTIKLKDNYEKIGNKTLNDLKDLIINQTRGLHISDISYDAIESSENFQGGSGSSMMSGSQELLRKMGMGNQNEKIIIKGQDFEKMSNLAELLEFQLEELENINNATISYSRGNREARILFNQYLMEMYGVTPARVANELSNFAPQNITSIKYKAGDEEYDIIIKDKEIAEREEEDTEALRTLEDLQHLEVTNSNNSTTELRNFSRINLGRGEGKIIRVNQDKEITVIYSFNSDINESKNILEAARMDVDDLIRQTDIPSGVAVEVVHEEDETSEFTFLILAAFAIIYMILASVFESVTAPVILMFAIPLAAIGSLLALLFTGNSLMNANVFIGIIILIGIVVNNSIILIDYTSQLRRQGYRKQRALIIAGVSRVRPILITAITTIVAMFPLAMGQGEFVSGLGAPFAITVIGGLTMSTLLTLVIIPTLYSGMEDALHRLRTQSLFMKLLQLSLLVVAVSGIYWLNASLLLKIGYLIGVIILIPAATWFVENSLRQANSHIIPPEQEIHISIRNLVKIYGRPNEFQREWNSGLQTCKRLGLKEEYRTLHDLQPLIWLLPITGFMFYFTYDYQTLPFWATLSAICTWLLTMKVVHIGMEYFSCNHKSLPAKSLQLLDYAIHYLSPAASLIWVLSQFSNSGIAILLGLLWYVAIAAHYLAERIHKYDIKIDQIEGRFKEIKKMIYQCAVRIPVIDHKTKPFKALNAVSMDIHTGMFGLLGPNGAGKTTLMRIICGIFEQSYGKIFINRIDTQKKREELQGLIGYLPQEFGTYENLTSWEYLEYQALLKGIYNSGIRSQRITEVLQAVHMYENKDKKIGGFSGGMKQRIGIAQTLLNLPRILVVDEPTAGLDPRERIRFRNLLVELSRNRIVIFSTHIIEDIASSCNQVGVINKGSLKYHGTPGEMVEIAKDVTWTFEIPVREFAKLPSELLIVHHIRNGENIKVRCLSESQPTPDAVKTAPLLEDSYLWLLRSVKLANHEKIITQ